MRSSDFNLCKVMNLEVALALALAHCFDLQIEHQFSLFLDVPILSSGHMPVSVRPKMAAGEYLSSSHRF